MRPTFDERDAAILARNMASFDAVDGPRVGDFVRHSCGTLRRFSHAWDDAIQTADERGGSFYLGDGYTSFSGSLYRGVPRDSLTPTDEKRQGRVWFFHHGFAQAHSGVDAYPEFRVWACSLPAEDY